MNAVSRKLLSVLIACMLLTVSLMPLAGAEEEYAEEQVLNLTYQDLNLIDVNDVRNSNEFQVLTEVQEGLFRTFSSEDHTDVAVLAGAESYEVSEDGLTYTFHLRPECKWSDGVPVTAQNYVDSWLRLIDPEEAFAYAELAFGIAGAESYYEGEGAREDVAIALIDDLTFSATLAEPDAAFLKKIGMVPFYPIRKDLIDAAKENGGNWTNDYQLHVFNGPFVIADRVLENSMTLVKNEEYWDKDNVYITQVNLRVVPESSTQAQLMESQQLDFLKLEDIEYVDQWQRYVDNGTFQYFSQTAPSVTYIAFDMHDDANGGPSGLMKNEKIRLAISLAFDREEYNLLFQNGLSTPAYSLVPYGMVVGDKEMRAACDEPLLGLQAQYTDLRALFEEGLKEVGFEGTPEDVTLTTIIYSPTTLTTNINEWYKQQLKDKIGLNLNVEVYPDTSTWVSARNAYQYDFYTMGWFGDFNDPITFLNLFTTGNGYARFMGGFSDSEYDALIAKASSSQDDAERLQLYIDAEKILMERGGTAPIYFAQNQYYSQSYVTGLSYPTFGAEFEFSRVRLLKH
ncbi:MAG: peptide ABC transporter substrate-binding protein [Clostridia bacterium]|nr:peptide ABC transporter substrate-binding protein [Clostridia bacterium]